MAENTYWEEELDKTGDIVLERKPRYFDCKFEIRNNDRNINVSMTKTAKFR
jgi:hypothetical protein